ncbi:hypothetical protein [Streptomyces sp. NPDC002990]
MPAAVERVRPGVRLPGVRLPGVRPGGPPGLSPPRRPEAVM